MVADEKRFRLPSGNKNNCYDRKVKWEVIKGYFMLSTSSFALVLKNLLSTVCMYIGALLNKIPPINSRLIKKLLKRAREEFLFISVYVKLCQWINIKAT